MLNFQRFFTNHRNLFFAKTSSDFSGLIVIRFGENKVCTICPFCYNSRGAKGHAAAGVTSDVLFLLTQNPTL
jgi:hypothetical protein